MVFCTTASAPYAVDLYNLLQKFGGVDTGYVDACTMLIGPAGELCLSSSSPPRFSPHAIQVRVRFTQFSIVASVRRNEGKICVHVSEANGPQGWLLPAHPPALFLEELELHISQDGTEQLHGVAQFGAEPFLLFTCSEAFKSDCHRRFNSLLGFELARLANRFRSVQCKTSDYGSKVALSLAKTEIEISEATGEVVASLKQAYRYLSDFADLLLPSIGEWDVVIGEDSGGRIATLFLRKVFRALGFTGQFWFVDSSKRTLNRLPDAAYSEYFAHISRGGRRKALFISESLATGRAYQKLLRCARYAFDKVGYGCVAVSTAAPEQLIDNVQYSRRVKPGDPLQFAGFEGIPAPLEVIELFTPEALEPDASTCPRPLGVRGVRYFPETLLFSGIHRYHSNTKPVGASVSPSSTELKRIANASKKAVRIAIGEMAERYLHDKTKVRI